MARIKINMPEKCISVSTIPVRITDVNYGKHVGNDSLVEIIHEARMQFLQQHNFTEMDAGGTSLIMSGLSIEFKNESFYKDVLEIKIFIGEITKISFEIFYSISVSRGISTIIIANAKTDMVCFNYNEKKVESIPEVLKNILIK